MDPPDGEQTEDEGLIYSRLSTTNVQGGNQISARPQGAVARPSMSIRNQFPEEMNQVPGLTNTLGQMSLVDIPPESRLGNVFNIVQNAHIDYSSHTQPDQEPEWQYRLDEANKIFVKTTGYENACDALEDLGHVLIIGSPGSGKTTMSLRIMDKYLKKGFKVKFYEKASQFKSKHVSQQFPTLLVFDDIFGFFSLTTKEIPHCMMVFHYLKTRFKRLEENRGTPSGEIPFRVIMNSRINVLEMVKRNFLEYKNSFFRGAAIADLTTLTKLSDQEKQKILKKHLDLRKYDQLSIEEIKTIASLDYSSLGFPHLCELLVDSQCPKDKILDFFQRPMMFLVQMIENIFIQSEERACMLLLMILNDGHLRLLDLQDSDERAASGLDSKLALCSEIIHNVPIPINISEAAKQEKGSLLTSVHDAMKFSHPTIHDAVALVVGRKNPLFVLKHCSLQFITERTDIDENFQSPSGGDYTSFKILLTADAGRFLLKRLAKEIVAGNYALPLSHQCLISEKHVAKLFEHLSNEDETHSYLHEPDNRYIQGFLFWSSFICMGAVTERCFEFTEFSCHEVLEGCFGCCMSGNSRSFQSLTSRYIPFHQAIVSSTLSSILEGQSETRSLYRSLSSASPTKPDIPEEEETVRMHGNNKDMLIHIAAANGFDAIVQILLDLGCNIDAVGGNEMTALMYACYLGHVELVKNLVALGADPRLLDEEGDNCLHLACRGGSMDIVRYLLAQDMDVNERGEHDRTPLMYASYNGHEEIAGFLLKMGAHPNPDPKLVTNKDNALHLACVNGHTAIVIMLLEEGGMDIEVKGGTKRTPIMYACRHGHLETAKELKSRGAKLDISDDRNFTCLHLATIHGSVETAEWLLTCLGECALESVNSKGRTPLMMAFQYGQSDLVEFLLQKGSNFDHIDVENAQCIHFAAKSGFSSMVDLCLERGQDMNAVSATGLTPVKAACRHGHLDLVKYLVEKGASVREDTNGGCLHTAVLGGHLHVVQYIVDTFPSLDINKPGFRSMTPLMIACKFAFNDIFTFLLSRGADVSCHDDFNQSCLHAACRGGSLEIVKTLISLNKFDVEETDDNGMTPLGHAVKCGNHEVTEYLVQEGADVHKIIAGRGYLHMAAWTGSTHTCQILLDLGINVDVVDNCNKTPLMSAVGSNHDNSKVVKLLLENGSNINHRARKMDTCLHDGAFHGHPSQIRLVLDQGLNPDILGNLSQSPLFSACQGGNRKAFELLLQRGANVHLLNSKRASCLHVIALSKSPDTYIANELLNLGLDINALDESNKTPVMYAVTKRHVSFIEFLLAKGSSLSTLDQRGSQSTLLHFTCNLSDMATDIPELLIRHGIDVDTHDSNNKTPVMCAVSKNNIDLLRFLLSNGCSLNTYNRRGIQNTLLHFACSMNNVTTEIIDVLISHGINVNSRNVYHQTPLMSAARQGNQDVVEHLRSRGADMWLSDRQGRNCMHHADEGGQMQMFEYLRRIMYGKR